MDKEPIIILLGNIIIPIFLIILLAELVMHGIVIAINREYELILSWIFKIMLFTAVTAVYYKVYY